MTDSAISHHHFFAANDVTNNMRLNNIVQYARHKTTQAVDPPEQV